MRALLTVVTLSALSFLPSIGFAASEKPSCQHGGHGQHAAASGHAHGHGHGAAHAATPETHASLLADAGKLQAEYDAIMARMHSNMALMSSGDADVDFIRGMIPHHQGAIEMARLVLSHGDDPQAQGLARNIIRAQKAEIAWMHRWLERRQLSANAR